MLIAHAPTGLLMAAVLIKLKPETVSWQRWYLMGAVMGLLPDLDMLWFYFVDHKQFHHHVYVPHWPIVWLSIAGVSVGWSRCCHSKLAAYAVLLGLVGMSHMVLDSVVGDIGWLKPWHDGLYAMFAVSNRYSPWQLNFIIHWSFAMELVLLVLLVWAVWQWRRKRLKSITTMRA